MCWKSLVTPIDFDRVSRQCGFFQVFEVKLKNLKFSRIPYIDRFLLRCDFFHVFQNSGDNWKLPHVYYIYMVSLHNSDTYMAYIQYDIWCAYYEKNKDFSTHMVLLP